VDDVKQHLPRGTTVVIRGQVQSMNSSYVELGVGIAFAILLVYFLMAVNFQSWLDPVYHHHGTSRRTYWDCLDTFCHSHTNQCTGIDGRDYVHRGRNVEQHSDGYLR